MADTAQNRMNSGIADLMRQYPRDNTPAYGDVPPGYMLARNADGKVVVVPANKYTPSTGARPDQKLTVGPNGEVVSSPYISPALDKALDAARGNASPALSFGETGMADPSGSSFFTPQYTDADFTRSLALQHPLNRSTTQEDIDEEARLRANLALSAREKQLQPQGNFFGGDQLLTKDRITQMYGEPSESIPTTLQQRSAPIVNTNQLPAGYTPNYDDFHRMFPPTPVQTAPQTDISDFSNLDFVPPASSRGDGAYTAVNIARQVAARAPAPMPTARPSNADLRAYNPQTGPSSGGGLAGLFNKPLSTAQLNQQSIDNPDDPGAWMRAERQYAATHDKDHPNFDLTKLDPSTGMNRGGTASGKSGKVPDPVHKALEIIHHLLMRQ